MKTEDTKKHQEPNQRTQTDTRDSVSNSSSIATIDRRYRTTVIKNQANKHR